MFKITLKRNDASEYSFKVQNELEVIAELTTRLTDIKPATFGRVNLAAIIIERE
jgi:hypothetical protein